MKMIRLAFALLLLVQVANASADKLGLPMAKPERLGFSSERLERFTQHIQQYIDAGKLSGAQLAIARRGKLVYFESLGWADIDSRAPIQPDTIFRIHSMTKPLTSVAAMMLVEEGRLKLTDPVADYIPAFANVRVFTGGTAADPDLEAPKTPMTIRHLLSHTAGMSGMGYENHPVEQMSAATELYGIDRTLSEFAERLAKVPLVRSPGEEFIYGPSTDLLGRVVEVASGQPFDAFLARRILEPLGMTDTHFILPPEKLGRFATAYESAEPSGELVAVTRPDYAARWQAENRFRSGGGGLVSTTADYLRFTQMLLNEGTLDGVRLLAPKTVQLMSVPQVRSSGSTFLQRVAPGYGFGLGFAVLEDLAAAGKPGSVGEYFWAGAADTYFFIDPTEQLIGLLMTQHYPAGSYQLREELQTFTYQALLESFE